MPRQRLEITRPKGINVDLSPYELPNEVWSEGKNINFRNFRTNRELGYSQVFPTLSITPLFAHPWTDFNLPYWFYASETAIYRTEGTSQLDVTRLSGAYTGNFNEGWTGSNFNGAMIMNNSQDAPQFFDTTSSKMADLTNWPTDYKCAVIRPFKNYLVALDITNNVGERFPTMVKWSDIAAPAQVPASWNAVDPAVQAGENVLPDSEGRCIDGRALFDNFFIYKGDSVWAMQLIGGNFVFSFRKVFSDRGILAKDCVTEFEGKHFVVGASDVYIHDGTTKESVISNKFKTKLYTQINKDYVDRVKCVADTPNKEVWIYFPSVDSTDGTCDKALVWNWEVNEWSEKDIENISFIIEGNINPVESDAWDDDTGVWDSDTTAWGEEAFNPSETELLMCDYNNSKFYQANLSTTLDGAAYQSEIERIGLDFGDDFNYKYINSITPHMSGEGSVNISVGWEDHQGQGVIWSSPVEFAIGVDYKADFRVSGRYIAVKFESTASNIWNLTGYTIEFEEVGER